VQRVLTGLQFLQNSKDRASGGFLPLLASETESGARNNMPVTEAQLITDGMGSILAGTDTTGFTLAVATWAIFSDEAVYSRHHTELRNYLAGYGGASGGARSGKAVISARMCKGTVIPSLPNQAPLLVSLRGIG
jgi:cytochrome P450